MPGARRNWATSHASLSSNIARAGTLTNVDSSGEIPVSGRGQGRGKTYQKNCDLTQIETKSMTGSMNMIELPEGFDEDEVIDQGIEDGILWFTYPAPIYGAINGYVRVSEEHPWYGGVYDTIEPYPEVNGGVTFDNADGWFGFDTLHAGDYWPQASHYCSTLPPECGCTAWTAGLVAEEARSLARQAAAVS